MSTLPEPHATDPDDPATGRLSLKFPVVGIGASAGGIPALHQLLQHTPPDVGMAFVVVLHLSASHESNAAQILQRSTAMPVTQVTETVAIQCNHVYVIAPGLQLAMIDGHLQVQAVEHARGRPVAIDVFFRTLAYAHRERAIAIVLSGTGTDGAIGLRDIKGEGGVAIAQAPDDAEYDGMPRSAIATDEVDFVLRAAEIPGKLVDLWRNAQEIELPRAHEVAVEAADARSPEALARAEAALHSVMDLLFTRTGHNFRHYKRGTVLRRIERRLQVTGQPDLPSYLKYLRQHLQETTPLLQDMLISVTGFFRDRHAFGAFEHQLAALVKDAQTPVRAWAAGCATGEEAYSLAMLLNDHVPDEDGRIPIQVFGSDIDGRALAMARAGRYPETVTTDVPAPRLRRYFQKDGRSYVVKKAVREQVLFARHNILRDPPFSRLDFISCRNLLIYLERDIQAEVLRVFHFALNPRGLLFLGTAESAEMAGELFTPVDKKHRIYRANPMSPSSRRSAWSPQRLPRALGAPVPTDLAMAPTPHQEAPRRGAQTGRDSEQASLAVDLHRLQAELHGSLDDSYASNEALHAANEELQSMNEELRSTTEELETSKEELQSLNEELMTVNDELKNKADDSSKAINDLNNLIASMDIATVFVDRAVHLKGFTPLAKQLFNLLEADVGRYLFDITHRLQYDNLDRDIEEVATRLRPLEREVLDQQGRCYMLRVSPYRTSDDRIDGTVLNFIDITARRKTQEELQATSERLRLVAENTEDYAIITLDSEGVITAWNNGAQAVFGYTSQDIVGTHFRELFVPEDRAKGQAEKELKEARAEGRAIDERWHLRKNGSRVYCSGTTTRFAQGEVIGFAKIARDRTEQKQLESQREQLLEAEQQIRQKLEAANAMRGEFLAVLSHELKNPLNLILMQAELVSRSPQVAAAPSLTKAVDMIRQTVHAQSQIIDDLLDLSRLNTGKLALSRAAVPFAPVIERIAAAIKRDVEAKRLSLTLENSDLTVYADPVRLEQIVWNLLSNAVKFTPAGGGIHVYLTREGTDAVFRVTDTGRGIEPRFVDVIFDMFQQGGDGKVSTRHDSGLGIGLALVKQLVDLHGGRVSAESEGTGKGATFTVWLPLFEGVAVADQPRLTVSSPLAGVRVLVVDDDLLALQALGDLLTTEDAKVTTASSGQEALTIATRDDFDLLVCDIAMPEMDGRELIARLRQLPRSRNLAAIAVSGFGRPEDVAQSKAAGFDVHLTKPLSIAALGTAWLQLAAGRGS